MAARATPNPATPVSSVAASTSAVQSAVSSSAAAQASSVGSSSVAASSASSQVASSASVQQSSSAAAASSAVASSSIAASSVSSSLSSSHSAAATIAPASASTSATSSGLSGGAIGGIVGGVVGGIALIALLWACLRRRKDKKDRVPPPPPRDFREMTFNAPSRPRMGSNNMMSQSHRASSYSTLIHPRPSSQYPAASRSPSYYATYPIATPSTLPDSPPMPASLSGESPTASGSSGEGHGAPVKPALAPIFTGLHRDNSDSSGDQEFGVLPKHKSSVDRLRYEGSIRAPSPASTSAHGDYSSRATSPHPSTYGNGNGHGLPSPSTFPRHSFNPEGGNYPRPLSMTSISSYAQSQKTGRYLRPTAPHGSRVVQLEMPKPLVARPDASGDFFWQTPKLQSQGFDVGFDGGSVHNHRISRAATELDMYHAQDRMPSSQSSRSTLAKPRMQSQTSSGSGSGSGTDDRTAKHSRSMQSMRTGR